MSNACFAILSERLGALPNVLHIKVVIGNSQGFMDRGFPDSVCELMDDLEQQRMIVLQQKEVVVIDLQGLQGEL